MDEDRIRAAVDDLHEEDSETLVALAGTSTTPPEIRVAALRILREADDDVARDFVDEVDG